MGEAIISRRGGGGTQEIDDIENIEIERPYSMPLVESFFNIYQIIETDRFFYIFARGQAANGELSLKKTDKKLNVISETSNIMPITYQSIVYFIYVESEDCFYGNVKQRSGSYYYQNVIKLNGLGNIIWENNLGSEGDISTNNIQPAWNQDNKRLLSGINGIFKEYTSDGYLTTTSFPTAIGGPIASMIYYNNQYVVQSISSSKWYLSLIDANTGVRIMYLDGTLYNSGYRHLYLTGNKVWFKQAQNNSNGYMDIWMYEISNNNLTLVDSGPKTTILSINYGHSIFINYPSFMILRQDAYYNRIYLYKGYERSIVYQVLLAEGGSTNTQTMVDFISDRGTCFIAETRKHNVLWVVQPKFTLKGDKN